MKRNQLKPLYKVISRFDCGLAIKRALKDNEDGLNMAQLSRLLSFGYLKTKIELDKLESKGVINSFNIAKSKVYKID